MENDTDKASFLQAYLLRLNLDPSTLPPPTAKTLQILTERHLRYIPFENLSLHMSSNPPSSSNSDTKEDVIALTFPEASRKVLHRHRGGSCLELNGLFSHLLQALQFHHVRVVPCWVYAGRERGHRGNKAKFRTVQSHVVILVSTKTNGEENVQEHQQWLVDVGLGEPPIHPLHYDTDCFNQVQYTPEGMRSRIKFEQREKPWFDKTVGRVRKCMILEWFVEAHKTGGDAAATEAAAAGFWEPRLQWDLNDAPLHPPSATEEYRSSFYSVSLQRNLYSSHLQDIVHKAAQILLDSPHSTLRQKLVCCTLTRTEKRTMAGMKWKVTSPRFSCCVTNERNQTNHEKNGRVACRNDNSHYDAEKEKEETNMTEDKTPVKTVTALTSVQEVRTMLETMFHIPSTETRRIVQVQRHNGERSDKRSRQTQHLWEHL